MDGDFPTNILSWIPLKKRSVKICRIPSQDGTVAIGTIEKHISKNTRLLCLSWVNSFTGKQTDARPILELCRKNKILFCLNGSQAIGYEEIDSAHDLADIPFTCGFKWLLGPYGAGFGFLSDEVLQQLEYNNAYWLNFAKNGLRDMRSIGTIETVDINNYDVFGTANFLNFMGWNASIDYLVDLGMEKVKVHDKEMIDLLLEGLDMKRFDLISPKEKDSRTAIAVIGPLNEKPDKINVRLTEKQIFISLRQGTSGYPRTSTIQKKILSVF